jgi:hypothetical protein
MTRLEWQYVNRPELSPILGSWLLLGHSGTWTPHPDVAPALVARKSVTVAPHTWWRLLALQGVPTEPLVLACILLAMVAGGSMLAALRLTGGEHAGDDQSYVRAARPTSRAQATAAQPSGCRPDR